MNFKKYINEFVSQNEFGEENHNQKKELIVLVGPPAIGKSTYINKFKKNSIIVSRDDIVDEVSSNLNLTYDDMFEIPPENAEIGKEVKGKEKLGIVIESPKYITYTKKVYSNIITANDIINTKLKQKFIQATSSNENVIVDMTNMTYNSRKNVLKYAEQKDFYKRAVVFTMKESNLNELLQRMKNRSHLLKSQGKSKTIGEDVIKKMLSSFQKITPEEGFDKVDTINTF